ncbi:MULTISPECIES: nicotinate-nucleotide--dimethylbenzimidazole phosphoribosyltransferase [Prochlorococcus]|uniref:nicotinate-nucleotide--dimethylbenzimidazole phosphoribosyltransferase n=1 Tax=Prochlorococcus TaxID=1218 RepID=UPI000533B627|nr:MULTISPECIES: TIGR00303 family protein [Prochlorococcus]KGG12957.1 Nicotinate-nucleotide--dimethylbenzimidazole phosphoribosyltransferase [Prochlorococcus sp. MIT 0601]
MEDSYYSGLPSGCKAFGFGITPLAVDRWIAKWRSSIDDIEFLLVLSASLTAEVKGISAAGATPDSRKFTAVADAELLLYGPTPSRKTSLPPLPAGVSPALISYVSSKLLGLEPTVVAIGLTDMPCFPHLSIEPLPLGPAQCLSTGKAMDINRVKNLWDQGFEIGRTLQKPLLITECVPGGTTTALAVLTGLGMAVGDLISGSHRNPPMKLKNNLVAKGLARANLGASSSPKDVLAAVGDPFQAFSVGLLIAARQSGVPVLLGGGSQMAAVLGLAIATVDPELRASFVEDISIATTSWLADEVVVCSEKQSSFPRLVHLLGAHYNVNILGLSTGLRFDKSTKRVLLDYEIGYVKEGVGAGALSLLAQINGSSCQQLLEECESAVDKLNDCA